MFPASNFETSNSVPYCEEAKEQLFRWYGDEILPVEVWAEKRRMRGRQEYVSERLRERNGERRRRRRDRGEEETIEDRAQVGVVPGPRFT